MEKRCFRCGDKFTKTPGEIEIFCPACATVSQKDHEAMVEARTDAFLDAHPDVLRRVERGDYEKS